MKHLIYFTIVFTLASCSNTKPKESTKEDDTSISHEKDTTTSESITKIDTIEKEAKVKSAPPILEIIEDEEEIIDIEISETGIEDIKKKIHTEWDGLLRKHVSSLGKVSYAGFKKDYVVLSNYIHTLKANTPKNDWTKAKKLAYWLNTYNAFTVKLIVENYPLKSIMDLGKPWDKRLIVLDGKSYSLGDVENDILRKMGDPRIHFGINCASISCPKLANNAFTEKNVYDKLHVLTRVFINDSINNEIAKNKANISKLFEWYKEDFIKDGTVIDYINKHSQIKVNSDAKIIYKEYNWNLNN